MLVYNEGVPRSGKSYDAILNHVLPALAKGRQVFARLNGLDEPSCRDEIGKRLGITRARVDELLIHVNTADVRSFFAAYMDGDRKWTIDPKFRNALAVIDEVHEFWEGGTRERMPPENEQFFALHGHYGMDCLVLTQFYSRIHKAIRHRIERKNVFQKLSALGSKGEKLYRQTYYQTIRPDKYEEVGGATHSYDESVFPCYHGIAPIAAGEGEAVQQAVYSGGRTSVWKSIGIRAAIMVPLAIGAIWYLVSFFTGGVSLVDESKMRIGGPAPKALGRDQGEPIPGFVQAPSSSSATTAPVAVPPPVSTLSPEQQYIWDLSKENRIRLAALIGVGQDARGMLEWVDRSGNPKDRLTFAQVRALDVSITVHDYGARLEAGDEVLVATAWPLNVPLRDVQPRLYDTSGADAPAVSASEPLALAPPGASSTASTATSEPIAAYGGFRQ